MRKGVVQKDTVRAGLGGLDLYGGGAVTDLEAVLVFCPGKAWGVPRY